MKYFAANDSAVREQIENLPNSNGFTDSNVQAIFNTAYALAGIVAAGFIVYGGIQYIIAKGEPGKIAKAKETIIYAVIGLIVVSLAAAITAFIVTAISGAGE